MRDFWLSDHFNSNKHKIKQKRLFSENFETSEKDVSK